CPIHPGSAGHDGALYRDLLLSRQSPSKARCPTSDLKGGSPMKKPMTFLLALGMLLSMAACGGSPVVQSPAAPPAGNQTTEEPLETASEGERTEQPQTPEEAGSSSILIAYFTWADNAVVEDPSS